MRFFMLFLNVPALYCVCRTSYKRGCWSYPRMRSPTATGTLGHQRIQPVSVRDCFTTVAAGRSSRTVPASQGAPGVGETCLWSAASHGKGRHHWKGSPPDTGVIWRGLTLRLHPPRPLHLDRQPRHRFQLKRVRPSFCLGRDQRCTLVDRGEFASPSASFRSCPARPPARRWSRSASQLALALSTIVCMCWFTGLEIRCSDHKRLCLIRNAAKAALPWKAEEAIVLCIFAIQKLFLFYPLACLMTKRTDKNNHVKKR